MAQSSDSATASPSPGPVASTSYAVEPSPPPGRPKRSVVWHYFVYDQDKNKSVCQIEVTRDHGDHSGPSKEVCGAAVTGKYPTNLKQHLRKDHPAQYQEALHKEEAEKAKEESAKHRSVGKQITVIESFKGKSQYDKSSQRYLHITKQLAIFIGSTNVPNSIVEDAEFRSLIKVLDSRYPMPSRTLIGKELDKVLATLKGNVAGFLSEARKVSLCADIWSKKGLSSSYLGVTAHFFSKKDHKRHIVTLCVRRMPSPHTAEHVRQVVEEVLDEWKLSHDKISVIITDSGSNMVAVFRQRVEVGGESDRGESEEVEEEQEDSEDEDQAENEEEDFETKELDREGTFMSFINRLACFAHVLQLVVRKFDEISSYRALLQRVRALTKRVNMSTKATEKLISLCGKKLIKDCPTRWSSTFLVVQKLLQVKSALLQEA